MISNNTKDSNTNEIEIEISESAQTQIKENEDLGEKMDLLNNEKNNTKVLLNEIISTNNNYTNGSSAYLNSICDYIKYKIKDTKNQKNYSIVSINSSLRKVLIFLLLSPLIYKVFQFAVSSISMERLYDTSYYVRDLAGHSYEWLSERSENFSILTPFLFGFGLTLFSWMIIYLDSNVPGVNPPSPFSPNSKSRHRQQKSSSMHLSYLTAIFSGIVVTSLMLYNS